MDMFVSLHKIAKNKSRSAGEPLASLVTIISTCFLLSACSTTEPDTLNSQANNTLRLEFVNLQLGDPDGQTNTYFADNSVATEAVEFSPNGEYYASVSKSKNSKAALILWTSQSNSIVWQSELEGETEAVTFTQDGHFIVTGGENAAGTGKLLVFDATNAKQVWSAPAEVYPKSIEGMRFSPKGDRLVTGDEAGNIVAWDTSRVNPNNWFIIGKISAKNNPSAIADVNQLDWTADGRYFVTAERDGDVNMYDVFSLSKQLRPQPARQFKGFTGHTVKSVRISPNNKYIAAGAGGTQGVRVWRLEDASLLAHLPSEQAPDTSTGLPLNAERYETIIFSKDSQYLIAGGTWPSWWFINNNRENKAYEVPLSVFKIEETSVEKIADYDAWRTEYLDINQSGTALLSGHDDGTIRVWRIINGTN